MGNSLSASEIDAHGYQKLIKALARGKKGSRSLTLQESFQLVQGSRKGIGTFAQLGAALMLMRVRGETSEEVAGVALAIEDSVEPAWKALGVTIDWPCYAGKRDQLPYLLLSAKMAAKQGHRVLLHGDNRVLTHRYHIAGMIKALGIQNVSSPKQAKSALDQDGLCYVNADKFTPLAGLFRAVHQQMGLRSLYQTAIRCSNPAGASLCIRSFFHPGLDTLHLEVAILLAQYIPAKSLIFKGYQGESEINPRCETLLYIIDPPASTLTNPLTKACSARQSVSERVTRITLPTSLDMLQGCKPAKDHLVPEWLCTLEQGVGELFNDVPTSTMGETGLEKINSNTREQARASAAVTSTLAALLLLEAPNLSVKQAQERAARLWRLRA